MEHLTDLRDPIIDIHFGAAQAQRGLTRHRDPMLAFSAILAAVLNIAHLIGVATVQHLLHETIIIAGMVTRMALFEDVPVIKKDLLEDAPMPPRIDNHEVAPSKGSWLFRFLWVKRFYHVSPLPSTLCRGALSDLADPGVMGSSGGLKNENSYTIKQLSARHLAHHGLNPRTYRQQFGIPRNQPLSAKATTAMRRQAVQNIRPWEKTPTYRKAHEEQGPTPAPPKRTRKKAVTTN